MGSFSIWHWLIVLLVVVILFGSKKLPDAARGLGRSMRILKSEMKEMNNESGSSQSAAKPELPAPAPVQNPVQPQANPEARNGYQEH